MSVRRSHQASFQISQLHPLDIPRQPERLQRPDAVPVHIDFVPGEAVLRRRRMRVVVVVPAFSKR